MLDSIILIHIVDEDRHDKHFTAGRSNMKYALGTLNAGGEMFVVTIFVNYVDKDYRIQHIKIERPD